MPSNLPKDWEMYAGIAFHAFLTKGGIINKDELCSLAVELGIKMSRAVEEKDAEQYKG